MLSDSAIREAISRGYISIMPLEGDKAIQPASVDLRLGEKLLIQRADGSWLNHNLRTSGRYLMAFGDFILGQTHEWITIKVGAVSYVGDVRGKSSRAREGIIVEAAGHFDPGWDGFGTLEISNRGRRPVELTYLMPICQMRFYRVEGQIERPYGHPDLGSHYRLAMGPEVSWTEQHPRIVSAEKPVPPESETPVAASVPHIPEQSLPETPPSEPTAPPVRVLDPVADPNG